MAMGVDPVPLSGFPAALSTTASFKQFAQSLEEHADRKVRLLARAAWMVAEELEVKSADLPTSGPEVDARHDQARSMTRVRLVEEMKEIASALGQ